MSSVHLVGGLPTLRFPIRGRHSRTFLPHRLSVLRAMWPAHCHFSLQTLKAMSVTLVLRRISSFRILSRKETPSIALSIARWVTLSFSKRPAVKDHVSDPYVITGNTHWLKTFVFRHCGSLDEKIPRNFPNAAYLSWVLRAIEVGPTSLTICPR